MGYMYKNSIEEQEELTYLLESLAPLLNLNCSLWRAVQSDYQMVNGPGMTLESNLHLLSIYIFSYKEY